MLKREYRTFFSAPGLRCPEFGCFRRWLPSAPRFERNVRRNIPTPMPKGSRLCATIAMPRFRDIFKHKSAPAKPAQQIVPTVQIFQRPAFAMDGSLGRLGQGAGAIIRLSYNIPSTGRVSLRLQVDRLFMLADVEAA